MVRNSVPALHYRIQQNWNRLAMWYRPRLYKRNWWAFSFHLLNKYRKKALLVQSFKLKKYWQDVKRRRLLTFLTLKYNIDFSSSQTEALTDDNSEHDNGHCLARLLGRWRLRDTLLRYRIPGDQSFSGQAVTGLVYLIFVYFSYLYHNKGYCRHTVSSRVQDGVYGHVSKQLHEWD